MTMQTISKTRTYPIVNVTIASNAIETVIRDSTEALGRNLAKLQFRQLLHLHQMILIAVQNLWNQVLIRVWLRVVREIIKRYYIM